MHNTYDPKNNEETFEVHPIGVRYKCEFCNNGEQRFDINDPKTKETMRENNLFRHTCTNCGKEMLLPKIYPYIEWLEK